LVNRTDRCRLHFYRHRLLFGPLRAALDFGVPAYGSPTLAYFWTKGSRDIVAGLLLASLLWLGVGRVVTATFLFVSALIPITDFPNVYINTHSQASGAMMIHGGTAVFMIVWHCSYCAGRQGMLGLTSFFG